MSKIFVPDDHRPSAYRMTGRSAARVSPSLPATRTLSDPFIYGFATFRLRILHAPFARRSSRSSRLCLRY